jgi:hypothetical protein
VPVNEQPKAHRRLISTLSLHPNLDHKRPQEEVTMKKPLLILLNTIALCMPPAYAEVGNQDQQLSAKDLATADGSCRVGLHGNSIDCILTAIETRVQLDPDSWSTDEESRNWTSWLSDFDNDLYTRWLKNASTNGQETVSIRIADGNLNVSNGTFLSSNLDSQIPAEAEKSKFEASIKSTLEQTLKAAPAMPQTKNKLKEIRTTLTFMRDPKVVPRYGKSGFGFAATRGADNNLVVYGRTKDGRSPGIQIISDRDGGNIQVTEQEPFLAKCKEIDSLP